MSTQNQERCCSRMPCPCTRAVLGRERPTGRTSVGPLTSLALSWRFPSPLVTRLGFESTVLTSVGRRSLQLRNNWEGNGRVVARLVTPPGGDVHRIKVDEKAGLCITTRMLGGLSVIHLFSSALLWSLPPVSESFNPPATHFRWMLKRPQWAFPALRPSLCALRV
jgi:hypothetical protein